MSMLALVRNHNEQALLTTLSPDQTNLLPGELVQLYKLELMNRADEDLINTVNKNK